MSQLDRQVFQRDPMRLRSISHWEEVNILDLKKSLKSIKLNESTISLIIGVLVIVVVGILVVRYFRNANEAESLPPITSEQEAEPGSTTTNEEGQKVYKVASGDSLWLIAQKIYGDGFKWTLIAQANNLTSPSGIEEGQELVLPETEETGKLAEATDDSSMENEAMSEDSEEVMAEEPQEEAMAEDNDQEVMADESTEETAMTDESEASNNEITGDSYTVVRGDNLWTICERAYGDGTKWVEVAKANELVNPDLIHAGNVFVLPR